MIERTSPLAGYHAHRATIDAAIQRVLTSGHYILGEEVTAFERELAKSVGVSDAVGLAAAPMPWNWPLTRSIGTRGAAGVEPSDASFSPGRGAPTDRRQHTVMEGGEAERASAPPPSPIEETRPSV
jgi:hypothetical protein